MMIEQTLDKLRALRLSGMVEAYRQQTENPDVSSLSFEERLGLMVDQHWTWRENKALARRLKTSRLETEPCVEDINYRYARQLDGAKLFTYRPLNAAGSCGRPLRGSELVRHCPRRLRECIWWKRPSRFIA